MDLLNSLHLKLALLVTTVVAAAAAEAQTKPGCNYKCGNVSIPYPFGTSNNCHTDDGYFINCTTTTNSSSSSAQPIAHLNHSRIQVLNISLDPPELIVSAKVSYHCNNSSYSYNGMLFRKFSFSNTKNRFIVVGCDTYADFSDLDSSFSTGCSLRCSKETRFEGAGACSGVGCCQTSFPQAISNYIITLKSSNNYTKVRDFNPCGYAFIAQEGSFNFSKRDLRDLSNRTEFPVVLDWAVSNQTCREAQKDERSYACKQNSRCKDSVSGIGYYCVCEDGFRGNPYLDTGCKGKPQSALAISETELLCFQLTTKV
ncbi:hypothetical protein QN277_026739 [Acacia crassicarpa]|uniref:EGF-like domain-containing protein n=1 Tax=Acacia crassicarpa TaxID=499986 RepID=A0AAE1J890_9FABA|nr:hypothetical protein QN277_026739 [Acacia crassicarpa]